jgi:putative tryptophan/tyrosine transport system permease protein
MSLLQLTGAMELGLIYSLVALGVFLSFRVLQFPDLTVDGSFPLGAAVTVSLISVGVSPLWATLAAILAGGLAGFGTAILTTRFKIIDLIAGIITMTALYSINIRVMQGRPNLSIMDKETLMTQLKPFFRQIFESFGLIVLLGAIIGGIVVLCYYFLSSQYGLALRATGNNARMARSNGISDQRMIQVGLALANGLVALGGSLFAQENAFADVNLGIGTLVAGLAAVILGETILSSKRLMFQLIACVLGAIAYRFMIAFALNIDGIGLEPTDLNLITATIVALAMILSRRQKGVRS